MRKLTFGMNVSLDGYIAAPGDDIGWSVPSDELFQWWSDRVGATSLALYGRKLWETMSSYWPTADQQPGVTPAEIEFARRGQEMPKVVFSSTISSVEGNTRLVTGDVFSGKIPDWMVQTPAASLEAISLSSSAVPRPRASGWTYTECSMTPA
jgi:dihydrofolate reductase